MMELKRSTILAMLLDLGSCFEWQRSAQPGGKLNEKNRRKSASPLEQLLTMPVAERIEAVVKDLLTRQDRFRDIDAHDLAEAIGVSDKQNPGSDEQGRGEEGAARGCLTRSQPKMRHIRDHLSAVIDRQHKLARPKRFELLTPRFVVSGALSGGGA
jgi:hypothetical protein